MRKLKIKEILDMTSEELLDLMSDEQYKRMRDMGIEHAWRLLEFLQDGARASGLKPNDDYVTMDEYLEYLEEIFSEDEN